MIMAKPIFGRWAVFYRYNGSAPGFRPLDWEKGNAERLADELQRKGYPAIVRGEKLRLSSSTNKYLFIWLEEDTLVFLVMTIRQGVRL
jgi:hypothetical protein